MKVCSKCKEGKDYEGFYKDSAAKDGRNTVCKRCCLERDRNRRKNDPSWVEKRKIHNHKFHMENRESVAERKKSWVNSEKGKKSHRESTRKWKKENNEKVLAHSAVERAVKNGTLVPKMHCEMCDSQYKIEAHHSDYNERLKVVWICKRCHVELT